MDGSGWAGGLSGSACQTARRTIVIEQEAVSIVGMVRFIRDSRNSALRSDTAMHPLPAFRNELIWSARLHHEPGDKYYVQQ
jgi:hypothetical protein